ncbi:hypothetical protein CsatA_003464 [Cannabis sativa]
MGLKSLANRNKGKRPVVEEDDSDFAPPLSKRGRAPPKKKSKVAAHEKIPQDDAQKNDQDGVGLRNKDLRWATAPPRLYVGLPLHLCVLCFSILLF